MFSINACNRIVLTEFFIRIVFAIGFAVLFFFVICQEATMKRSMCVCRKLSLNRRPCDEHYDTVVQSVDHIRVSNPDFLKNRKLQYLTAPAKA